MTSLLHLQSSLFLSFCRVTSVIFPKRQIADGTVKPLLVIKIHMLFEHFLSLQKVVQPLHVKALAKYAFGQLHQPVLLWKMRGDLVVCQPILP